MTNAKNFVTENFRCRPECTEKRKCSKRVVFEDKVIKIKQLKSDNPTKLLREIAELSETSVSTVQRVLRGDYDQDIKVDNAIVTRPACLKKLSDIEIVKFKQALEVLLNNPLAILADFKVLLFSYRVTIERSNTEILPALARWCNLSYKPHQPGEYPLTESQIIDICNMWGEGYAVWQIAHKYRCSETWINKNLNPHRERLERRKESLGGRAIVRYYELKQQLREAWTPEQLEEFYQRPPAKLYEIARQWSLLGEGKPMATPLSFPVTHVPMGAAAGAMIPGTRY